MSEAKTTTHHDEIKRWAEARQGIPARVKTSDREGGILRIDFGEPDDTLERIDWDQFFKIFDENDLQFLYQEKTEDGHTSRFNKFIRQE
jgi:hypothetical protein